MAKGYSLTGTLTEQDALLALNAVTGLGSLRIHALLEYTGSAAQILQCLTSLRRDRVLSERAANALVAFNVNAFLEREKRLMDQCGCRAVIETDVEYPALLKEIPSPPVVLYIKGRLLPLDAAAVAVVGSRRASVYGMAAAERLSARLAACGITVVSGLARGIDTAAHRAVVRSQGRTLAVMGCGLTTIYPPENRKLAETIVAGGALISEFPMEAPVRRAHFPRRNRIISGLSLGVLVVEAAQRSGALITSQCALDQNRDVFAVPGPVDRPNSRGTHGLIRDGAKLIMTADDILAEIAPRLKGVLAKAPVSENEIRPLLAGEETLSSGARKIYQAMPTSPVGIEQLARDCGLPPQTMAGPLFQLQMAKVVRQLPGQRFVKRAADTDRINHR